MTTRWRTTLVVLAATLAGVVRAEPTLRYNYSYACNQEHIVVGHCRKDSDTPDMPPTTPEDDFCQLYYPDRPKTGGIEAMGIELRSDVIKMLQACGAFGAPKSASTVEEGTAAAAPPRPSSAVTPPPRAPSPSAAPSATATPAGTRPATFSGQAICDAIRHAGSLAAEEFRSIDLGPGYAMTETINVHKTSLKIAGASGCDVSHEVGKPNEYSCNWPQDDAAERQLSELAQTLKTCIGGQYEFHEWKGDIDSYATARKAGVEYEAALNYDFVSLSIRPIKTAPAAAAAASGAAPVAAPGIGQAHWRNLNYADDLAVFVLPANLKPGGPTGRGWFLKMYRAPKQSTDGRITQIAIAQELWTADCKHNTIASLQSAYFSGDGAPLGAYVVPSPEHISVDPGTFGEDMLNLLCARPYELDQVDYDSDAVTIRQIWLLPTKSNPSAPAAAGAPPQGSAETSSGTPGGRPPPAAMPIGPPMCPLLRRLEGLAHEDFRSIDRGPDRTFGKDAEIMHRTSMPIPGTRFCNIDHSPGEPITYSCTWPQSKEVEDQFVSMVKALANCTGGTPDLTMVNEYKMPDVTVTLRGVEYHTVIVNDWLNLNVHTAKP